MPPGRAPLYTPLAYGTNAVKRLGEKIGSRSPLEPDEQDLYELFIRDARQRVLAGREYVTSALPEYSPVLHRFDESVEVSGRWKTLSTLADKLERTPQEKLPSIHDVAGLRVVADVTTFEQRVFARALAQRFDSTVETSRPTDVIDRIESPSHGYRAVHLVVWPSGRPMEVQVRTQLQHAWAQLMEALGDRWGRELRYGLPVRHPSEELRAARQERVALMLSVSQLIATFEERTAAQGVLHMDVDRIGPAVDLEMLERFRSQGERSREEEAAFESELRTLVASLRENPTAER